LQPVVIYTDGACSGNGRADAIGGWAAILVYPSEERELSGSESPATNQRMELRAAIEGLTALADPSQVTLYSDSRYLVNCFRDSWHETWRQNGWRNSGRKEVANRELWEELLEHVERRGHVVEFLPVVGHADKLGRELDSHERYNQRCDQLAVAATATA
jgi:ribonuclease HI